MSHHSHKREDVIFEGSPECCGACGDRCRRTRWLITTTFIEKESGICCPSVSNLQLLRVKDISYTGCCGCCGTITIVSSDESDPILQISGLPNSHEIYSKIRDAVDIIGRNARLELNAQ